MIARRALTAVQDALSRQAAVALIGPRQVGKTTLAHTISAQVPSLYLDLEAREDRVKLSDPALFLRNYEDRLPHRQRARRCRLARHGSNSIRVVIPRRGRRAPI